MSYVTDVDVHERVISLKIATKKHLSGLLDGGSVFPLARRELVYLAAPLFCDAEHKFSAMIAGILHEKFDVYLPQKTELRDNLYVLHKCDLLLILLDGPVDEDAAFELGFAYAMNKKCLGLQTDERRYLNPTISVSVSHVFFSVDELRAWVRDSD